MGAGTATAERPTDDPLAVLLEMRQQFVEAFPARFRHITVLTLRVAGGDMEAVLELRRDVHKLAGLGGTIGLPRVSERASAFEELMIATEESASGRVDRAALANVHRALGQAFADDTAVATAAPEAADVVALDADSREVTVLVVEDDPDQRQRYVSWLRQARYRLHEVGRGDEALAAARACRPDAILLDIDLPGLNGRDVCRQIRLAPDLSTVPVVFLTTRNGLDDRLTGLSLGADDYIAKPVDARELTLRLKRLVTRPAPVVAAVEATEGGAVSEYDAFLKAASASCATTPACLAFVRLPRKDTAQVLDAFVGDARRTDLLGRYDRDHLIVLMPKLAPTAGRARIAQTLAALQGAGIAGVHAGFAALDAPRPGAIETLLAEADEALNAARYENRSVSTHGEKSTPAAPAEAAPVLDVVIADDDPDIVRIVDSQLRSAGFRTRVAFDGMAAIEAVDAAMPDLLLLDLMMPRMNGFEVLGNFKQRQITPRSIVLSARGREEDVTRAFQLGAEDYLLKPFNPAELMARARRLLR